MPDHCTIPVGYAVNADGTRRALTPEENARDEKILRASFEQCKESSGLKISVKPKEAWVPEGLEDVARRIMGPDVKITVMVAPSHVMSLVPSVAFPKWVK